MKDKEKFREIYKNIYISEKTERNIFNKTVYKKEIYGNYKKNIWKFITIVFIAISSIGIVTVAKEYIQSFIINKYVDEYGSGKLDLSLTDKVTIKENHSLMCHDNLTLKEVELNLGIKLLNYQPFNKNTFDECEIITDDNGNIRRVRLINEDNSSEYSIRNKDFKKLKNKKYLYLSISFMTNYATLEDETHFTDYFNITTSDAESLDEKLETHYIENLGMDVNIVKWADHKDYMQNMAFFVYDNVFYDFQGTNITVEELINILENL